MIEIGENLQKTIITLIICIASVTMFYLTTRDNKK